MILDELFGNGYFRNELIWRRTSAHSDAKQGARSYGRQHDTILFYTKSETWTWNQQYSPYDQQYIDQSYRMVDENGRRFQTVDLTAAKPGGDTSYEWKGYRLTSGRYWAYSRSNMEEFERQGRIYYTRSGLPRLKYYLDEMPGVPVQDLWVDVKLLGAQAKERVEYRTQKPEALLERIIQASSNEGDLVLDCFVGSDTTAAVAEKLNRRWIAADLGRFAIHTTRKRLLAIPDVRPFVVQNLGKYERQAWQSAAFSDDSAQTQAALAQARYRQFILDLYHATPIDGYSWLHGVKAGHYVHVGSVDAPVLVGDIRAIAQEFWKVAGKENADGTTSVDVLGWDFAFELNEMGRQMAAEAGIAMTFKRIPRDVMDRRAVEQGEITFFELAALALEVSSEPKCAVRVQLRDFIVPADDVPQDVQQSISHWSQYIDYWAVDWNYRDDTFHNQWQSYRTKKQTRLELAAKHTYDEPGSYTILVKVIDILGNDTTRAATVEVQR